MVPQNITVGIVSKKEFRKIYPPESATKMNTMNKYPGIKNILLISYLF